MEINRVLKVNCSDVNALLSKAEALYGLGLFEKSMIQHYRGIKIRPDFQKNIFSKGIRYFDCKICQFLLLRTLNTNFFLVYVKLPSPRPWKMSILIKLWWTL